MSADEIRDVIDALYAHYADDLTPWEANEFLPSLSDQYDRRGVLSEKQKTLLDKIWARVTSGGSRPGRGGF